MVIPSWRPSFRIIDPASHRPSADQDQTLNEAPGSLGAGSSCGTWSFQDFPVSRIKGMSPKRVHTNRFPSGDQTGVWHPTPGASVSCSRPPPSGLIVQIWDLPLRLEK